MLTEALMRISILGIKSVQLCVCVRMREVKNKRRESEFVDSHACTFVLVNKSWYLQRRFDAVLCRELCGSNK